LIHRNVVRDDYKVLAFNSGYPIETPHYILEFDYNLQKSGQTDYKANKYRIIGLQIFLSQDKIIIDRVSYGLGELLGEIGGLFKALELLLGAVTLLFAHNRLVALLSNRLYKDDPDEKFRMRE
jgi:hypothetical protein